MKSKYFGYTLRGAGTPYQQWILSELPTSVSGIYTTSATSEFAANAEIPMQCIILNQAGCKISSDGSILLPQGLYKIEYSGILSTAAASPIKIDLTSNGKVVSEVQGYTSTSASGAFTDTISGFAVVRVCGCNCTNISLVNASAVGVTPVLAGNESMRIFVTRLV